MQKLNDNFIVELIKLCILNHSVTEIVSQHLDYSFIELEQHKTIFKYIFDYFYATSKSPTIGTVAQNLPQTKEYLSIISEVRLINIHDRKEGILQEFETFIKKSRFIKLHQDVKDIYNNGEHEKAMNLLEKESSAIVQFSLLSQVHSKIFQDFDKRQSERKQRDFSVHKLPTGIPALDHHSRGGVDLATAMLIIARKGVGKSGILRSLGFNFAFRGYTGVHFQGEGTKAQVEDAYDAMWTGVDLFDIKSGDLNGKAIELIEKARKAFLAQSGEIIVVSYEQFEQASIAECRQIIIDLFKKYDLKWALFDYLEKFNPGDKRRYGTTADAERMRKLAVAEKIVNIATEFKIFCGTATQANDIEFKDWNNPNFIITRNNISNLKATIDPFAWCLTLNQTMDENDRDIIRLHEEAMREYKINSWESTYHIAQKRECGRFIDVATTNQLYWDPIKKQVIKNVLK